MVQELEITDYRLTRHAALELERRSIPRELLDQVVSNPEQILEEPRSRLKILQSKCDFGESKIYLLRVIVDENRDPATIVTAYRTSKIKKYWGKP